MVVIFFPAADATGSTQDRTALPSRCTVHAPHWAIPQPYLTPVTPHRSRSAQSSGISSGASTSRVWPFSSSFMGGLRWLPSITAAAANGRHGTIKSLPDPMSEAADRWHISTWASTMTCMTRSRNSLAAGIALLAPQEGGNETRYPGVSLYRFAVPEPPTRYVYPSSLVLVGAGRKQVSLGNKTLPYDAGHYLVVTSPMPILCRTIASADDPVLSMVVEIELALVRQLILEFERPPRAAVGRSTHTVFSAPLPRDLEDAAARLLTCLADERRRRALARQTIREMLFLVLDGPQGDSLRALAEGPAS